MANSRPVKPRQGVLALLHVIEKAAHRIRNGAVAEVIYDPQKAQWVS
jgi:hypothetical protein